MRILFLTSRLPFPPDRGDRLRVFNFIRELSRQHRITLLSFVADESEIASLAGLRPYCEDIQLAHLSRTQSISNVATRALRSEPLQALYYHSPLMHNAVDKLTRQNHFDLVYVHLFRMAQYGFKVKDTYQVLDLTDVISAEMRRAIPYQPQPKRAVYQFEVPRIQRYEQQLVRQFNETWVISENEKLILNADGSAGKVIVVPNGVDSEHFHPRKGPRDANEVLFVGHMSVPHNEDAAEYLAREIMPLVRRSFPMAHLKLIGAQPSDRVRRLAELDGVAVLGHVPDLNAALNEAAVFVAPLRFAAGVQNKVLEAMAAGTPVVTTSIVRDGLNATDGTHLLVADTAEAIAEKVVRLLANRTEAQAMAVAAKEFVVFNFHWSEVSKRVDAIAGNLPARR